MLPISPPKISLAQLPTPLRTLGRLNSGGSGPRVWVKQDDLTGCSWTGNKIRKLEFVLADALAKGCNTVITCGGVQSNHCRATALAAARLGMKAHLLLRGERPEELDGNLLLDGLSGARISFYSEREYLQGVEGIANAWISEYADDGIKAYFIPTGASNCVGLWGYISAAKEMYDDFEAAGFRPDAIIVASGSGGTQGGLTLGMQLLGTGIPVYGMAVCDSSSYFEQKIRQDVADWYQRWCLGDSSMPSLETLVQGLTINTIDKYIGPGYALGYPEVYDSIQKLASLEGIVLDPVYTGKAFYGMMEEASKGVFRDMDNIVFVHTGGIFGLFPYRMALQYT